MHGQPSYEFPPGGFNVLLQIPMQSLQSLFGEIAMSERTQFSAFAEASWVCPSGETEAVRQKHEAFKAHVTEMIDKLGIEVLAEEFSEEAKRESEAREFLKAFMEKTAPEQQFNWETARAQFNWETVLEQLRKAKGIDEHRFCDPDSEERKALGIEDPDSERGRAQREQEWLSRIADSKAGSVV